MQGSVGVCYRTALPTTALLFHYHFPAVLFKVLGGGLIRHNVCPRVEVPYTETLLVIMEVTALFY